MKIAKKISFWLALFSLAVCLFNLSGEDDKNLLLFFTNPLLLALNGYLTKLNASMANEELFMLIVYGIHLGSWLIAGLLLDGMISRLKQR
ncbi:hypothetical protein [Paenibacillus arenilitoris]|uniref:Uncharacterized protein n=1 Tax=Paenibacillus arenilitoris TaxID=2772299 RepID=A0A927H714_9BACL|nr:hypothetical protein [Paenibacillus arenilitoris]MBD2870560.1 hypothetical protein [Paenibacillus arenilitoris]